MWTKSNIIKLLLFFFFMLWHISFFNTFNFIMPLGLILLLLFLFYHWNYSFRFLFIFLVMWFEFYSVYFTGFYFILFAINSIFLYFLIKKTFATKSRFSLIILVLLLEVFYLLSFKFLIFVQNFLMNTNFINKINPWLVLKDIFWYLIIILVINEIISLFKKKFLFTYE